MNFQSYSQAGQDCFAYGMNGGRPGMFLDIGCGHPTAYNNSYGLELLLWQGVCIDIHKEPAWDSPVNPRNAFLIIGDATKPETLQDVHKKFDYLSIDCDEASLGVLLNVMELGIRAKCITIEHDAYRIGDNLRNHERHIMWQHGYVMAACDVLWEGKPFEDWWILPA